VGGNLLRDSLEVVPLLSEVLNAIGTLMKFVRDLLELFTYLVEWKQREERYFM